MEQIQIVKGFLSNDECAHISNVVKEREAFVKSLGDDLYSGTSDDSLTGRYYCYNFINNFEDILVPKLRSAFLKPISVQCWANIFRYNEGILPHSHNSENGSHKNVICGNIFISGDPTIGTRFNEIKYENSVGELVLFNPGILHSVDKNRSGLDRVSLAMDIHNNVKLEAPRYYYIAP